MKIEFTKEALYYYYIEQNLSQKEVAQLYNCKVCRICKELKKFNITKDISKRIEKYKKTCLEKYGVDNPFKDTKKIKESYIKKLGVEHPMKDKQIANKVYSKINYKESIRKGRETDFKRTGYDNPSHNPECLKKGIETKIKNGDYDSPKTSHQEDRLEKLLKRKFTNVVRQYRDTRYARNTGYMFECDFYIPEEDLFIELNAYPSHYTHPYDDAIKKDVELKEKLQKSNKKWDNVVYDTWCIRDVEKITIAKKNKLNYIVLYPSSSIYLNKKYNDNKYSKLVEYLIKKLNT